MAWEALKRKGDACSLQGDFKEAIRQYTSALESCFDDEAKALCLTCRWLRLRLVELRCGDVTVRSFVVPTLGRAQDGFSFIPFAK